MNDHNDTKKESWTTSLISPVAGSARSGSLALAGSRPISVGKSINVAAAIVIIAAIYLAQEVLIPLALALLLSFMFAPLVVRLRHWKVPRFAAVLLSVFLGFALIATIAMVCGLQLMELGNRLPDYQVGISKKLDQIKERLRPPDGNGHLDRLFKMFSELKGHVDFGLGSSPSTPVSINPIPGRDASAKTATTPIEADPAPVPVVVEDNSQLDLIGSILGTSLDWLVTAGIVLILVIFILLSQEDIRNRMIRLMGIRRGQLFGTTQAIEDAATRVSRYLLMQLIINVSYGVVIGLGLFFIGIPNSLLWGVLGALLRFIPYLGPILAGIFPFVLAIAVDPTWAMLLWTTALYVIIELLWNNAVEPWLYGSATGISSMGILLSAVFWGWMWGPIGLLMSTPLTVCFVVLGRHIPALSIFSLMLGDEPVLPLHARIYQRLLARDAEEPDTIVVHYLRDHTVLELYEEVLLPLLRLLEDERIQNPLDPAHESFILDHVRDLIEDVAEHADPQAPAAVAEISQSTLPSMPAPAAEANPDLDPEADSATPNVPVAEQPPQVVCIPALDESDELVALMLANLICRRGVPAVALSSRMLTVDRLELLSKLEPQKICISALPPDATMHARHSMKRLRMRLPDTSVVVGFWDTAAKSDAIQHKLARDGVATVVTTLKQATDNLISPKF